MGAAACVMRGEYAAVPRQPGASCTWQLMAELAPEAAWLCTGTWGSSGMQERVTKDGEQSRLSPGKERPTSWSGGLSVPLLH